MKDLLVAYPVPEEKEMLLYTYVLYTCGGGGGGNKFFRINRRNLILFATNE